jgi:hypothetical protein
MSKQEFPIEIIELPSKGKLYSKDNPLSKGTLELKYMTAREEDILASQNLIRKGVVLDKLFEAVVVQEGVNIDDIFVGDKNAILLATRVLGYGKDYNVEVTDPFTGELQKVTIDLAAVQIKEVDFSKLNSENVYEFVLPQSKTPIKFRLLTHKDEVNINAEIQALKRLQKDKDGASHEISTRLRHMIVEVDGNAERGFINKWVMNQLRSIDSRELRNYVKEISPDVELKFEFTSDLTGETEALDIPFGASFFYPST